MSFVKKSLHYQDGFFRDIFFFNFRPSCDGKTKQKILKKAEEVASNIEEMMKFRDSANGKAQREKLQSDFLNFNNAGISPTKQCFYEKGYEYLDVSSRNMYVSYAVSTKCQISIYNISVLPFLNF